MSKVKFRRKTRRRRANKLQPLTPEAHAAAVAASAQARARWRSLRQQWAADDAMYRSAAILEYERRSALRRASHTSCAEELTARAQPRDQVRVSPDS